LGSLKGRQQSEDLGVYGRKILKRILGEIVLESVDWIHVGSCKDGNEPSVPNIARNFLKS
jgi:hypothetical protein